MNKILKTALCGVALVPVAFCFSACSGDSANAKSYNELLQKSAQQTLSQNYDKHTNKVINQTLTYKTSEKALYEYKTSSTATSKVKKYHTNTSTATRTSTIEMVGQGESSAFRVVKTESMVSTEYEVISDLLATSTTNRETIQEWYVSSRVNGTETEYIVVYTLTKKVDGEVVPAETIKNYQIVTNHEGIVADYLEEINEYLSETFYVSPYSSEGIMGLSFDSIKVEKSGSTTTAKAKGYAFEVNTSMGTVAQSSEADLEIKFKGNKPSSYKADLMYEEDELDGNQGSATTNMTMELTVTEKTVAITLPALDGYTEATIEIESPISEMGL